MSLEGRMYILNKVRLFIESYGEERKRMKDIVTVMIIVYFTTVLAGTISLFKRDQFLKEINDQVGLLIKSFRTINDFPNNELRLIEYPEYILDFSIELELLKYLFFTFVLFGIVKILNRIFRMKRMFIIIMLMTFQTILSSIFFRETIPLLIVVAIILSILFYFIPLGSGAYFSIIEYGSFLTNVYSFSYKEIKSNVLFRFLYRLILPIIPFLVFVKIVFPSMSIYIISITYFSILLLIFMNSNENNIQSNLKKIVVFSIIIILTISNQQELENDPLEILLLVFTIFFSLDRVLSAFKDLKHEIQNNSLLFILEKKAEDVDWLIENNRTFTFHEGQIPSESFLIKQIIISFHLSDKEQVIRLSSLYEENYIENKRFILQLKYFFIFSPGELKFDEKYEYLSSLFEIEESKIEYFPTVIEYVWILFLLKKDYQMIIDFLSSNWFILDDYYKYILYCSYIEQNKTKVASEVKKEISNFDTVEEFVLNYKQEFVEYI